MDETNQEQAQEALSRLPRGRYLLTAGYGHNRNGMIVERVSLGADDPPTVIISVKKGHSLSPLIRDSARFGIAEIGTTDEMLSRIFRQGTGLQDDDPFLGHALVEGPLKIDIPIPERAVSWLACELLRHLDIEADHEVYIGRVISHGINRQMLETEIADAALHGSDNGTSRRKSRRANTASRTSRGRASA